MLELIAFVILFLIYLYLSITTHSEELSKKWMKEIDRAKCKKIKVKDKLEQLRKAGYN